MSRLALLAGFGKLGDRRDGNDANSCANDANVCFRLGANSHGFSLSLRSGVVFR